MVKEPVRDPREGYAFQLEGDTVFIRINEAPMVAEADRDMARCLNRETRKSQSEKVEERLMKDLMPAVRGYKVPTEDDKGWKHALGAYITDLRLGPASNKKEVVENWKQTTRYDRCVVEAWRKYLRQLQSAAGDTKVLKAEYWKGVWGKIVKGTALFAGLAGLAAGAIWATNAFAQKGQDQKNRNIDHDALRAQDNAHIQQISAEEMEEYQPAQQGWVTVDDVHETKEIIQKVRPTRPVVPSTPKMIVDEVDEIQAIQQQVEQNTVEFQKVMRPAGRTTRTVVVDEPVVQSVVQPAQQVIQPVEHTGDLIAGATRLGEAYFGYKAAKASAPRNCGNTYVNNTTCIRDNGNVYDNSDHSVRKDSHNRTDASSRTLVTNNGNTDNRLAGGISGSFNRQSTRTSTQTTTSSYTSQRSSSVAIGSNNTGSNRSARRASNRGNCETIGGQLRQGSNRGGTTIGTGRVRTSTGTGSVRQSTPPTTRTVPSSSSIRQTTTRPSGSARSTLSRASNAGAHNGGASFRTSQNRGSKGNVRSGRRGR